MKYPGVRLEGYFFRRNACSMASALLLSKMRFKVFSHVQKHTNILLNNEIAGLMGRIRNNII